DERPLPDPAVAAAAARSLARLRPGPGRVSAVRRLLVALLLVALVSGCGGGDAKPRHVTATVNADGSYRVGTTASTDANAAVKAAVKALPAALSYDYRKLDAGEAAAAKLMTSSFGKKYEKTFEATTRPMATQKQAITSALVRGAGIVGKVANGRATV